MNRVKSLFFVVLMTLVGVVSAKAQEGGDLTVGAKMNIYARWDGVVGIGPFVRYSVAEHFRVESALLFLTKKGTSIDWSNELHMPYKLSSALEVYPLVGVSLNDPYKFGVALGLGGGAVYNINSRLGVTGGVKWNLQSQKYVRNALVFSVGVGYRL